MKRRLVVAGAALALGVGGWLLAPMGLSRLAFFRVRQVDVVGLHYLPPDAVVEHIGIEPQRNVFQSLGELRQRAEHVPGIVKARVERRLPGTLRFVLQEEVPVAFARGDSGLVPLDAQGRPLPYVPSVTGFDLPLVERPDSVLTRALALVRGTDSTLFRLVDGARRGRGSSVVLDLGAQRVLLPEEPTSADIVAVETVRWHLTQSSKAFTELDARFDGWVVVRRGGA